jgi:peptidoglycan-associated lipoprotein
MTRRLVSRLAALVALALVPLLSCGGPRYPSCDKDEQCNGEGHKGVCLDHLCTECRDDTGCDANQRCKGGACVAAEGYCDDSHACSSGDCGKDHKCHEAKAGPPVECDDDRPCLGGARCENGHCVTPIRGGPGCTDFPAVKFDFDSPDLRGDVRQVVERLARCLSTGSLKGAGVMLTGHCDARGENEYNMSLGAQRAENVKTLLIGLGVPIGRVNTSSRGKLDATGSDEASMANDRRVDIEVR